jgi:hypothetical protein
MKTRLPLISLLALLLLAAVATAQGPEQVYDLTWWTVDGGGATSSTGGSYRLGGTIGQPDAGTIAAESYVLQGGFWPGGEIMAAPHQIYLPLVMRNS